MTTDHGHAAVDTARRNRCAGPDPRGIPTTYRGISFRSRLESRWAAFFDSLKWPWTYEPIDLAGYIPDFILSFEAGPLLVEVKPATAPDEFVAHRARVETSGWTGEALLVGVSLWGLDEANPRIGEIGRPLPTPWGTEWEWGEARLFRCLSCGGVSLLDADASWHCRACGTADRHLGTCQPHELEQLWSSAGNRVQWRAC